MPGGKVYVEDNMDRFGLPIRPMKPLNIVPGPDHYFEEREQIRIGDNAKGGTMGID